MTILIKKKFNSHFLVVLIGFILILTGCQQVQLTRIPHPAISHVQVSSNLLIQEVIWHPITHNLTVTGVDPCGSGRCDYNIYEADPSNGEIWPLLNGNAHNHPAWTHNGDQISFLGSTQEGDGIYLSKTPEYNPYFFRDGQIISWSSDGKYAVIGRILENIGNSSRSTGEIRIINLQTDEEFQVYQTAEADDLIFTDIDWSPESDRLLFSIRAFWNNELSHQLYTYNLEEKEIKISNEPSEVRHLGWLAYEDWFFYTFNNENELGFAHIDSNCTFSTGILDVSSPSLSPRGDQIAFVSNNQIYLINLELLLGPRYELLNCDSTSQ